MTEPVLQVRDLVTSFYTDDGVVHAVDGVSFDVFPGETLGIVGESGCGKSVTALSIMGLVPEPGRIVSGRVMLKGEDLTRYTDSEMREVRGRDLAMIFQDPLTSLNPVLRVGFQVDEAMRYHDRYDRGEARSRTAKLLEQVRIPAAAERARDFPHQFSGGMRQRVMVAMGLANDPAILIADEPTTALDVTVQAQMLDLLRVLNRETGAAVVLITHNLGVVAGLCDRVLVMYAGRVVEHGPVDRIFARPQHPYTWSLLRSVPRIDSQVHERLRSIHGLPPDLLTPPTGCRFHPRCPNRIERCDRDDPRLSPAEGGGELACWAPVEDGDG
ncbi:MAG: ABC transporter ATP-binding protein [Candidatus Dormibacteria bacterium]